MTNETIFTMNGETSSLQIQVPENTSAILTIPSEGSVTPTVSVPTVVDNLASFSDVAGNMEDSGIAKSTVVTTTELLEGIASYAGGSASFNVTVAGVTTSSNGIVQFATQVNSSVVRTTQFTANTISVVASADPGTSTIRYLLLN